MELHTCLWNDVAAFDFAEADLKDIGQKFPILKVRSHSSESDFLCNAAAANILLTWDFPQDWYRHCANLELIITPAAGKDWIEPDPTGKVAVIHGTFHGNILAESLLSAILFMNHRMPSMIQNFSDRKWQRDLQTRSKLLSDQTVLIIGFGHIGQACAHLIESTGARVIGVNRSGQAKRDAEVHRVDQLAHLLPMADHVVLLLPETKETDGFMNTERLLACKQGVNLYNFGRGNALRSDDLLAAWTHIGGAFLDVTDVEPLPMSSPLWQLDNIMITPHSSCIYQNYKTQFVDETCRHLSKHLSR